MNFVRFITGCFFFTLVLSLGCSSPPPTSSVSGKVTLNGVAVDGGRIQFIPIKGAPVEGDIKGGHYEVAKVLVGEVKVSITWTKSTGKQRESYGPGSEKVDIKEEAIPAIYNTKTELKMTVEASPNTKDFDLKVAK